MAITRGQLELLLDLEDVARAVDSGVAVTKTYYAERIRSGGDPDRQFQRVLQFARDRMGFDVTSRPNEDGEWAVCIADLPGLFVELELAHARLPKRGEWAQDVARLRIRRKKFRAEGRCVECGVAWDGKNLTCAFCTKKATERGRLRRERRLLSHVCQDCGKERADPTVQRCKDCRKSNKMRMRATRRKAKRKGLCADCFKVPRLPNFTRCLDCLDANRGRAVSQTRKDREKLLRDLRKRNGQCVQCGRPAKKTLCAKHLRYKRLKQRVYARRAS